MKTLARPATAESGILALATEASTAASYWIGPSLHRSGRRSRTSSVAARTLSPSAPAPASPAEQESSAIPGSHLARPCARRGARSEGGFTAGELGRNIGKSPGSTQRVDFALRRPGRRDDGVPLWLPIDAKFPREDYERLLDAQERADPVAAEIAGKAIDAVKTGAIRIYPEQWVNTYNQWMNNIQDWTLSRQLWWGHQIPAWYGDDGSIFVARSADEARSKAEAAGDSGGLVRAPAVPATWY